MVLRQSTPLAALRALRSVAGSRRAPAPGPFRVTLSGNGPSRRFGSAALGLWQQSTCKSRPTPTPEILPPETLVDEEQVPGYDPEHYYPAHPGDLVDDRYLLLAKVGWGSSSTVWLARVMQSGGPLPSKELVIVKLCNCDVSEEGMAHELDITIRISDANPQCRGSGALGTAICASTTKSPRGQEHLILVFEPKREPFWLFKKRLKHDYNFSSHELLALLKIHIKVLLEGLDYLHSQCHVIHADLKSDNIMVTFEDQSTIEAFAQAQAENPMARKQIGDHTVYRCHNDFGPLNRGLGSVIPQIIDFGHAHWGDRPGILKHPIQPDGMRAPEVLLGTGWSYSADMWNFGVLIWDLLAGRTPFDRRATEEYSPAQHLADMISLLGPIPPLLVQRERDMRHEQWTPAVCNPEGKLASTAAEFYGGPFFTDEGTFTRSDLVTPERSLESEVRQILVEESCPELFLAFMRRMLCWLPEERATAGDLLKDPWLESA